MEQREKDIQTLCNAILYLYPTDTGDYGSGGECPFCKEDCSHRIDYLKDAPHKVDCPVLIAKDLTTNYQDIVK